MHMYFLFLFFQVVKIPLVYEPLVVLKSTNFFEFKFIIKCSLFTLFWFLYKLIFILALPGNCVYLCKSKSKKKLQCNNYHTLYSKCPFKNCCYKGANIKVDKFTF